MVAARLCSVPHRVYHNHGMAAFSSSGLKRVMLAAVEKITCGLASIVVFCGKSTLDEAVRAKYCTASKATVIGRGTISGIDLNLFQNTANTTLDATTLRTYGLRKDCFTVGYIGRIVAHKGIDNIVKAWPIVQSKTHQPTQLILAGDNDKNELFKRLTDLCKSHENVKYLGRVEDIKNIYRILDVLILPSWHEGFPYSVLEAQCSGVPAIVTEVPGNIDAVIPETTGLYIPPENPDLLAEAICKLAENPEMRTRMSQEAAYQVRNFYSRPAVLENLKKFYRQLLQQ